jgi:alanyl-tRNA synthetase
MERQRDRARAAIQKVDSMQVQGGVLGEIKDKSDFVGYNQLTVNNAEVVVLIKDGEMIKEASAGDEVQLILDKTPFYAESGGQIADEGVLTSEKAQVRVKDVQKAPNGQNLHNVIVESGILQAGDRFTAIVSEENRNGIVKNHTATHLLHQALKDVLGTHVNQAGSLVTADRLRFDFSHFGQVSHEELTQIEHIVNEQIWKNIDVAIGLKSLKEAKEMGAMALFGEKYGEIVRVVEVGNYSLELCGGCHVDNTATIGLFKIVTETGIGAGTRRIEAVTGKAAYQMINGQLEKLQEAASLLKANPKDLVTRIDSLLLDYRELQRENESLTAKLGNLEANSIVDKAVKVNGVTVLATKVNAKDMNSLRGMMDDLKDKLQSAIVVLGSSEDNKVNLVAGVTKDLVEKGYHAGKLIKEVAERCGGKGGGRPEMAQAGAKNPEKLTEALKFVEEWVESVL